MRSILDMIQKDDIYGVAYKNNVKDYICKIIDLILKVDTQIGTYRINTKIRLNKKLLHNKKYRNYIDKCGKTVRRQGYVAKYVFREDVLNPDDDVSDWLLEQLGQVYKQLMIVRYSAYYDNYNRDIHITHILFNNSLIILYSIRDFIRSNYKISRKEYNMKYKDKKYNKKYIEYTDSIFKNRFETVLELIENETDNYAYKILDNLSDLYKPDYNRYKSLKQGKSINLYILYNTIKHNGYVYNYYIHNQRKNINNHIEDAEKSLKALREGKVYVSKRIVDEIALKDLNKLIGKIAKIICKSLEENMMTGIIIDNKRMKN